MQICFGNRLWFSMLKEGVPSPSFNLKAGNLNGTPALEEMARIHAAVSF